MHHFINHSNKALELECLYARNRLLTGTVISRTVESTLVAHEKNNNNNTRAMGWESKKKKIIIIRIMKEIIKNKAMINKTNIMHFQALLLQIVAVIITYTSGLEQVQYTVKLFSMEKIIKKKKHCHTLGG